MRNYKRLIHLLLGPVLEVSLNSIEVSSKQFCRHLQNGQQLERYSGWHTGG